MDNDYRIRRRSVEEQQYDEFLSSMLPHSLVKTVTKESLLAAERKHVCRVMESLSLREHHSRTLLIHYHWDVEKLFAVLECKGKACLLEEVGIPVLDSQDLGLPLPVSMMVCGICALDIPTSMTTKMDCGHCFCNSCWTDHFILQINEGQSRRIRCMAPECSTICDEAIARKLVLEKCPDLADKFDLFLLESYIDENKMVKWCPSVPHCGNAISVEGDELCEVKCSCGKQFCFGCLSDAHSPCSCAMWALLKEYRDGLKMTINLINATKPCPKCHELVEKNGGGNLVTCSCGQLFCWPCGCRVGRKYSHHKCDFYKKERKNNFQLSTQVHLLYMHYHDRYKAHTNAIKQESTTKRIIVARMIVLKPSIKADTELLWVIKDGLHKLFRSRRTLANSYPFMFGSESVLFKDGITAGELETKQDFFELQHQLEEYVKQLCILLEEHFHLYGEKTITWFKQEVASISSICDTLCKHLHEIMETELLGNFPQSNTPEIVPCSTKGIEEAMSGCNIMSS